MDDPNASKKAADSHGSPTAVPCDDLHVIITHPMTFTSETPKYLIQRDPTLPRWHMFFEVMNQTSKRSDIAAASTHDLRSGSWSYRQVVLHESFHLSYPFTFFIGDTAYMVPEGRAGGKVTLYYSPPSSYPSSWLPLRTLLQRPGIDSSFIFHFDGQVYMFVFFPPARLELFLSPDILSREFRPHPKSPIYNSNKKYARNGGRPYFLDGLWHRPAQDISNLYGSHLHVMRITLLSENEYHEEPAIQLLPQASSVWGGRRLHHMDLISFSGGFSAPATGASPQQPLKEEEGDEFAVVIDGNWTTIPSTSRYAICVCVILLLLVMFDAAMAPRVWGAAIRTVFNYVASFAAAVGRCLGGMRFRGSIYSAIRDSDAHIDEADEEEMHPLSHNGDNDDHCIKRTSFTSSSTCNASAADDTRTPSPRQLTGLVFLVILTAGFLMARVADWDAFSRRLLYTPPAHLLSSSSLLHNSSQPFNCPSTLVSALFDTGFGVEFSREAYLSHFKLVMQVDTCHVLFTDTVTADLVRSWRVIGSSDQLGHTHFIITSLSQLSSSHSHLLNRIDSFIRHPASRTVLTEKNSSQYTLLSYLKTEFVLNASLVNPFNSSHFFWIDGDYGNGHQDIWPPHKGKRWPDPDKVLRWVPPHAVVAVQVGSFDRPECSNLRAVAENHRVVIASGFFGGAAATVQHVARLYEGILDQQLAAGPPEGIIHDDQLIWLGVLCLYPQVLRPLSCVVPLLQHAAYCGIFGDQSCMTLRRFHCPAMFLSAQYEPEEEMHLR